MKVSVIIPVFNREKYIIQAIESCLIQPEVGQVIVIDDCSTDDTLNFIKQVKDTRLNLYKLAANSGASAARNEGLKHVACELVSFLDSDDYYLANRFKEPVDLLSTRSDINGTYEKIQNFVEGDFLFNREDSNEIVELKIDVTPDKLFDIVTTDYIPFFSIISIVLKRDVLKNLSFDLSLKFSEDKDFIYQILQRANLVSVNKENCFIQRRLHDNNLTNSDTKEIISYTYLLLEKWFRLIQKEDFSQKQVWNILYRKVSMDYIKKINSNYFIIKLLGKFWILLWHLISKPILIKKLLF